MNIKRTGVFLIVLAVMGLLVGGIGCTKATAPAPPEAIRYELAEGTQLSKVTWYIAGQGPDAYFNVDVEVKNTSTTARKLDVGVQVDDGVLFFDGVQALKEVKPGETLKYSVQSTLKEPYPKKLYITVAPK